MMIRRSKLLNNAYRDKLNTISSLFANIYADMKLPFGFNYKISYINRFEWEKTTIMIQHCCRKVTE